MKPCQERKIKKWYLVLIFGIFLISLALAQDTNAGWTSGKFGLAINFDGINDYVNSNSNIPGSSAFSYSLWFKSSDGAFSADEYLFTQGTNNPSAFIESTDSKVYVMADNANLSSNTTVNDTKWHHLEITADGTAIKLYLDGILEDSATYTGSSTTGVLYVASNATPGSYFGGLIDDVRIYNYARTPDEVRLDYNAGFAARFGPLSDCESDPGACMDLGLVGYWSFDEGAGATTYDGSGNNNHGELKPSATNHPAWTTGKVGGALQFDGVDDCIELGVTNNLWVSNDFTIEAWIYFKDASSQRIFYGFRGHRVFFSVYPTLPSIRLGYIDEDDVWRGITGIKTLSQDTWYHVVAVKSSTTGAKLYVNGELDKSDSNLTKGAKLWVNTAVIGCGYGSGTAPDYYYFFDGLIDELRVYKRVLSAEEIRYHYNRGGPILHWKFDEGSGTTTYDSSGNAYHGTLNE